MTKKTFFVFKEKPLFSHLNGNGKFNKAPLFIHSFPHAMCVIPHIKKKRNLCYMCVLKDNVTGNKADKFTSILLHPSRKILTI